MSRESRRHVPTLLGAIGLLFFIASEAAAQLPFTVTGVDGSGRAKSRVQCVGQAEKRKSATEITKPEYDLKAEVSCSNPAVGSSANASVHSLSSKTGAGQETWLKIVYEADAAAFQAVAQGNFKLEGESDAYWEIQNTTNSVIVIEAKWSATARTKTLGVGSSASAEGSFEITDEPGNPLKTVFSPPTITGTSLICVPANAKFYISMYAYATAKGVSINSTVQSAANGFGNAVVILSPTNFVSDCDSVIVQDREEPPPDGLVY
jgi:hypothetical protein